jgi:Ca-activated chloride channel family protein
VSLGGAQDAGFFRGQLEAGLVPSPESLDAAGFFAEHHTELPSPSCGNRVCLQPTLAVMGNLMNGADCTMLHLGLNSPLAADPGSRPPLTLSVVVDVSGSMLGQKLQFLQEGLELLIDGMHDDDRMSLVSYSDQANVVAATTDIVNDRASLRQAVRSLVAAGSTNLSEGLLAGYREVLANYDSTRQNRVILLSDGNPTAGLTASSQILEMSRAYNSDGVGLTTIGLGQDFNISLMRDLALQADGNFYFLEDAGAVSEVFTEELSFFVVPVAFDLELSLSEGEAYSFGRAFGTPFWQDSEGGGALSIPSVFLAHREADTDVTEDDGRRGGGSQLIVEMMPSDFEADADSVVATVSVSFREPGQNERIEEVIDVRYPYAPGALLTEGFFDANNQAAAQKSFVMLNIFVGMQAVVEAFARGVAGVETIASLDNLIAAVNDYNDEVGDKDVELDLELLDMLRANLLRAGVPESVEPPPADPWPAD